jgi:hypothetical protein
LEYSHLLKGMRMIKQFSRGDKIPNSKGLIMPHKVRVYYDAPRLPAVFKSISAASGNSLEFTAAIAGAKASVLIDTGASECFLNDKFCKQIGLKTQACRPVSVTLGDGSSLTTETACRVSPRIQGISTQATCLVIPMPINVDMILGRDWMIEHSVVLDLATNTCVIKKGARTYNLRMTADASLTAGHTATLKFISTQQVQRAQRNGCHVLMVDVKQIDGELEAAISELDARAQPVVREFADVFQTLPPGLPPDRGIAHTIPLIDGSQPVFSPMYRYSPAELAEIKSQLKKLLELKFIEPSQSSFGSPVLFVLKKDGSWRMCVDYRRLNNLTKKNRYPLPRIDETLDQLQGVKCMSSLDLQSGYHQIRIAEEDVEKTAFRTPFGHYQFRVLSFGLTNAPSVFQATMNSIFSDLLGTKVLVYLDDILVISKDEAEHEADLREVLGRLRQHTLYAKLSKCEFFKSELPFLGHIVGRDGIRFDPKKS